MRLFPLYGYQDIVLYLFPALIFIVLFGLLLARSHFRSERSEVRRTEIVERFPDDIEGRDAPFPVGLAVVIGGTLVWAFFYILYYGLFEVRI